MAYRRPTPTQTEASTRRVWAEVVRLARAADELFDAAAARGHDVELARDWLRVVFALADRTARYYDVRRVFEEELRLGRPRNDRVAAPLKIGSAIVIIAQDLLEGRGPEAFAEQPQWLPSYSRTAQDAMRVFATALGLDAALVDALLRAPRRRRAARKASR